MKSSVALASALTLTVLTALLLTSGPVCAAWLELQPATAPSARYGHTMSTVGSDVYLFGGTDGLAANNELWKWDRASQSWMQISADNPPPARYYHGAAATESKLYIGFGFAGGVGGVLGDLWEYDPKTNSWTQLNLIHGPVAHFLGGMAMVDNGRIFVAGGYDDGSDLIIDAWLLDVSAFTKDRDASKGVPAQRIASFQHGRYGFSAAGVAGRPLLIGGWSEGVKDGYSSDIFVWNPEPEPAGSWEPFTPMGEPLLPRVLAATVQLLSYGKKSDWGDEVWILGGEGGTKQGRTTETQIVHMGSNYASEGRIDYGDDMPLMLAEQAAAVLPPISRPGEAAVEILMFGGRNRDGDAIDWTFLYTTNVIIESGTASFLPAAAHAAGLNDTLWITDLEILNRSEHEAHVDIDLLEKDSNNSNPRSVSVTVPAGQSRRWTDVLDELFSFSGGAALRLRYLGDLLITSRTYTPNPDALVGGSFGQFIPAEHEDDALAFGDEARLIQLTRSSADDSGFRSNLGFVNATAASISMQVDLYDSFGLSAGSLTTSLPPFGYKQISDVFGTAKSDIEVSDGYAIVQTTSQDGRFFTYASVVDNVTGDPVYVSSPAVITDTGYITAAAHAAGSAGSVWRSHLQLHNAGNDSVSGYVGLLFEGQDNSSQSVEPFNLAVGRSQRWQDVIEDYFQQDDTTAALHFVVESGSLMATSRTFNDLGADGTYGQFIPCVDSWSSTSAGEEAYLIQLTRTSAKAGGFRTNIGVLNTSGQTIEVEIALYLADGTLEGTLKETLAPWQLEQINDAFDKLPGPSSEVSDGFAVIRTTTTGGTFLAYASVVDNATNDPIYIPGMQ